MNLPELDAPNPPEWCSVCREPLVIVGFCGACENREREQRIVAAAEFRMDMDNVKARVRAHLVGE